MLWWVLLAGWSAKFVALSGIILRRYVSGTVGRRCVLAGSWEVQAVAVLFGEEWVSPVYSVQINMDLDADAAGDKALQRPRVK